MNSISIDNIAVLGSGAFAGITGEIVNVDLQITTKGQSYLRMTGLDVAVANTPAEKAELLVVEHLKTLDQRSNLNNPDKRISLDDLSGAGVPSIADVADFGKGSVSGDGPHYIRKYWELSKLNTNHKPWLNSPTQGAEWSGREHIIIWGQEPFNPENEIGFAFRGQRVFGKKGVAIGKAGQLRFCHYNGELFDDNLAVLCPNNSEDIASIWEYCVSGEFAANIKKLDKKMSVTAGTFVKVPYDPLIWRRRAKVASSPKANVPTQWIHDGHPKGSDNTLQTAVARFLGYGWPRQTGLSFMDCPAISPDGLETYIDADGIACLIATKGEAPAHEQLNALLANAFGSEWSAAKLANLLTDVNFAGETLNDWLRDGFFEQHCTLFQNRPFIWHIWDGRRDGFQALVNYHKLAAPGGEGRQTLEKLIYSYLGDWIDRQRSDQKAGIEGADGRLAAAEYLRSELTKILEGEPPYDIFVRWKPLFQQPIGWEPDINDGVRMNIRPFMTARPLGARAKTACILRTTPKSLKWDKDRGKESTREKEDYPWFWGWDAEDAACAIDFAGGPEFDGNRWNEPHYTRAFKEAARVRQSAKVGAKT